MAAGLACGLAVRPVVSLKSDVTTTQVKKLPNQTESDWSGYSAQWSTRGTANTGEAGKHGVQTGPNQ